jgi:GNAT superfamily N-acetyltransferase
MWKKPMETNETMHRFTAKDGRKFILRTLRESELENARQLFVQIFREDRYLLNVLLEKRQKYQSLFVGCFNKDGLVGVVFGWPDPRLLVVKAIAVMEPCRRRGIGTALLKAFENAATEEGFENFVLGAKWEAVPFYVAFGLKCLANVQVKPDEIPWDDIQRLRAKYGITGAVVFGPPALSELVSRLYQELEVRVGTVDSGYESVSIQIQPKTISEEALEEMKKDFKAYATQFCFKKKL